MTVTRALVCCSAVYFNHSAVPFCPVCCTDARLPCGGCAEGPSLPRPKAKKGKAAASAKRASGPGNAEEAKRLREKLGEGSRLLVAQAAAATRFQRNRMSSMVLLLLAVTRYVKDEDFQPRAVEPRHCNVQPWLKTAVKGALQQRE